MALRDKVYLFGLVQWPFNIFLTTLKCAAAIIKINCLFFFIFCLLFMFPYFLKKRDI